MQNEVSIKIKYWAIQDDKASLHDFDGIDELVQEISPYAYISTKGLPGDRGGGLYEFLIEFDTTQTIFNFLKDVTSSYGEDLFKMGAGYVFNKLVSKCRVLFAKNKGLSPGIDKIVIEFSDSKVIIYNIFKDSIFDNFEKVFTRLHEDYEDLKCNNEFPSEIHLPIFEDPSKDRLVRFRVLLSVDENIKRVSRNDFFKYWGLMFKFQGQNRVFDVEKKYLIDEDFAEEDQYWQLWMNKNRPNDGEQTIKDEPAKNL